MSDLQIKEQIEKLNDTELEKLLDHLASREKMEALTKDILGEKMSFEDFCATISKTPLNEVTISQEAAAMMWLGHVVLCEAARLDGYGGLTEQALNFFKGHVDYSAIKQQALVIAEQFENQELIDLIKRS